MDMDIDDLQQGDIINIRTVAKIDGEISAVELDAMIYGERLDPENAEFIGFEVLPVTRGRQLLGQISQSHPIRDSRDIASMGLGQAFGAFIHLAPVVLRAEAFEEEDDELAITFKGRIEDETLLQDILDDVVAHDDPEKIRRTSIYELGEHEMVGGLPGQEPMGIEPAPDPDPAPPTPDPGPEFDKAVLDIKLEDAGRKEVYWIDHRVAAIIGDPKKLISKREQIKKGIIQEGEEPVGLITTMRQLERTITQNPERLKAFKGLGGKVRYQEALEDVQEGIREFNEAIKNDLVKEEPYSKYVFEVKEPDDPEP